MGSPPATGSPIIPCAFDGVSQLPIPSQCLLPTPAPVLGGGVARPIGHCSSLTEEEPIQLVNSESPHNPCGGGAWQVCAVEMVCSTPSLTLTQKVGSLVLNNETLSEAEAVTMHK